MKMDLKMSSAKWQPYCPGEDVLTHLLLYQDDDEMEDFYFQEDTSFFNWMYIMILYLIRHFEWRHLSFVVYSKSTVKTNCDRDMFNFWVSTMPADGLAPLLQISVFKKYTLNIVLCSFTKYKSAMVKRSGLICNQQSSKPEIIYFRDMV